MILGITSLGQGSSQLQTRAGMWVAHMAGGAVGGAAMGAATWLLLTPVRTLVPTEGVVGLFLLLVVIALLIDLGVLRSPFGGHQVPQTWTRRYGLLRSFMLYGLLLGSGLLTHVNYAVTLLVFSATSLFTSFGTAVLVGVAFGLGRTAVVGPAALQAERSSRILYRSGAAQRVWPVASALLSAFLGLVVLSSLWVQG
jgi:hypothetical protein